MCGILIRLESAPDFSRSTNFSLIATQPTKIKYKFFIICRSKLVPRFAGFCRVLAEIARIITPLLLTLTEPQSLNPFRIRTYEKVGGRGGPQAYLSGGGYKKV
jgi:hypothetical protein